MPGAELVLVMGVPSGTQAVASRREAKRLEKRMARKYGRLGGWPYPGRAGPAAYPRAAVKMTREGGFRIRARANIAVICKAF